MEDIANGNINLRSLAKLVKSDSVPKLTQICRICLCETNDGDPILDATLLPFFIPHKIRNLVQQSTTVQIIDLAILPNQICEKCLTTLKAWHKFRSQTQRSDEILKEYLRELGAKLDSNSLPSTDLIIHIKGKKVNVVPAQNVNQIEGFEVTVLKDKPEVIGFVFHCDSCEMSFTNQIVLNEHNEEHIRIRNEQKCKYCNKIFTFRRGLKYHVAFYHENQNKCEECNMVFRTETALRSHKRTLCVPFGLVEKCKVRPKDVPLKEIIAAGERTIRETKISCVLCKKKKNYKTHGSFAKHLAMKHHNHLSCSICHKTFQKVGLLERHVRKHLHEKMYTCPICPRSFYARVTLRTHIKNHTKKKLVYRCNVCQKDFFLTGEFKQHMREHLKNENSALESKKIEDVDRAGMDNADKDETDNECDSNTSDDCKFEDKNEVEYEEDEDEDEEDEDEEDDVEEEDDEEDENEVKMTILKEEIDSDGEIPNNEEEEHKPIKIKMEFPPIDLTDFNQQFQIVKSERGIESDYKMETDMSNDLDGSNKIHTEVEDATKVKSETSELKPNVKFEKPELNLSADESDNNLSTLTNLDGQNESETLSKLDDQNESETLSKMDDQNESEKYTQTLLDLCKVTCHVPGCQMEFPNFRTTVFHFSTYHLPDSGAPFECVLCFEKFQSRKFINVHIKKHYTFKCPVCSRSQKSYQSLHSHIKRIHSINRFQCSKCEKTFGTASNRRIHEITHNDEKQFFCSICQKGFFSNNGLYLHMSSHKVIKELQCEDCGRQLASKSRLKRHYTTCARRKKLNK